MPKIVPIPYQVLVKIFELDGFSIRSQKGDHITLVKPGVFPAAGHKDEPS